LSQSIHITDRLESKTGKTKGKSLFLAFVAALRTIKNLLASFSLIISNCKGEPLCLKPF